jgi:hypothetical protein
MTEEPPAAPGEEGNPGTGVEPGRATFRELLHHRKFLLFEASGALASAGYAIYSISVLFLAYGLTGNLVVAGAVLFLEYGVYTATFLVAPLVDRARDKRALLLVCYPLQALAAALLALGLHRGDLTVPELLGLVAALALLWDFVWAVYMVSPKILLTKPQLLVAGGISNAFSVGTQVGGYAGGGALLFLVGPAGGATAYVVLLVAAILPALFVPLVVADPPRSSFPAAFREGWAAFRGRAGRAMRAFAGVELLYGFFSAVPILLVPALAYQRFPNPSAVYGPLVTAYALGGALGGIVLGRVNPRGSVGLVLIGSSIAVGALVLLLDAIPASLLLLGAVLGGIGAGGTVRYTAKYAWVQATYPAAILGRLISNLYLFGGSAGAVAVLTLGLLSNHLSLAALILLDGLGLLTAGLVAAALPFLRRLNF